MNCFVHPTVAAVGSCAACQKGICRQCVGREAPRLFCRTCVTSGAGYGYEYRSSTTVGGWPLVHVATGFDMITMRPRVAKGVIAIGNIAVGGIAIGGVALGAVTLGGCSLGLVFALGGLALGLGLSIGGVAIGSIAFGGLAIGFMVAVGGSAFGPATITGVRCDPAAREFLVRWLGSGSLPPTCR